MKRFLITVYIMTVVFCGNAQKVNYDPVNNNVKLEKLKPRKTGKSPELEYNKKDTTKIKDDYKATMGKIAKEWLEKAKLLKKIINDTDNEEYIAYKNYITEILKVDIESYKKELEKWIKYLQDYGSYSNPNGTPFANFPMLRDTAAYKKGYDTLYDVNTSLDTGKYKPEISHNPPKTLYKEISRNNIEKEILSKYYNDSIGTAPTNISTSQLRAQVISLATVVNNITVPLLDTLSNTKVKYGTGCCEIKRALDSAEKYEKKLTDTIEKSMLYSTLNKHKVFFTRWLWYAPGEIRFNPFPFTHPDKFKPISDAALEAQASLFDSLAALKLKCPTCPSSLDTLEYLVKQQGSGALRFGLTNAAKEQAELNKKLFESFLNGRQMLYRFEFPYREGVRWQTYIHSYDAALRYSRTDKMNDRAPIQKQWEANSNIPYKKNAAVLVYNIPSATEVKINPKQADTTVQAKATAEIGTVVGDIAAVASKLSPVAAAMAGISNALQSRQFRGASAIPQPELVSAGSMVVMNDGQLAIIQNPDKHLEFVIPPQRDNITKKRKLIEIRVRDTTFLVKEPCETCGPDGKYTHPLAQSIAEYLLRKDSITCIDTIMKKLLDIYEDECCTSGEKYEIQCCLNKMMSDLDSIAREEVGKMNKMRKDAVDTIRNAYKNSEVEFLLKISGLQALPENLNLNDNLDAAGNYNYAKLLFMPEPDPSKSAVKFNYTVEAKAKKDTSFTGNFVKSRRKWYMLGAGFVHTFGNLGVNKVTAENPVTFKNDDNSWRFVAGIHFYPAGMLLNDDRFISHRSYGESSWRRLSLFLGVGIPKPLENFYLGISADLVPAVRIHTGARFAWYTKYEVTNNQLAGQRSGLEYGGWYVGMSIDPTALAKALSIF